MDISRQCCVTIYATTRAACPKVRSDAQLGPRLNLDLSRHGLGSPATGCLCGAAVKMPPTGQVRRNKYRPRQLSKRREIEIFGRLGNAELLANTGLSKLADRLAGDRPPKCPSRSVNKKGSAVSMAAEPEVNAKLSVV
jgi:hypothetical protein